MKNIHLCIDLKETENSNAALTNELKSLYGELGEMLATKQKEIESQSKFVKPSASGDPGLKVPTEE